MCDIQVIKLSLSKRELYELQKQIITTSPEFLDLMWNVIDDSLRLKDAKFIIKVKYPELLPFVTDDVIEKSGRLYHLSKYLSSNRIFQFKLLSWRRVRRVLR
jgi:hypothetical protein